MMKLLIQKKLITKEGREKRSQPLRVMSHPLKIFSLPLPLNHPENKLPNENIQNDE